jgi:glutathione peroxidase
MVTSSSRTAALGGIPLKEIDGSPRTLDDYRGEVLLLVNVASKCGLTPQYEALERVYRRFRDRKFRILAFPANDFLQQEPGSDQDIQSFCKSTYDVSFPLFSKISVVGESQHPLYRALVQAAPTSQGDAEGFRQRLVGYSIATNPAPGILWNFEKFLIDREGKVSARFAPSVEPEDALLTGAIERLLAH